MYNVKKLTLLIFGTCVTLASQAFALDAWVDFASAKAPADTVIQSKTYYKIASAADLAWFSKQADLVDESTTITTNAILTADIDLAGKLWTPIAPGTGETRYQGIFDGNGHTIRGMYIKGTELIALYKSKEVSGYQKYIQNLGLFGTLGPGSYVKNLIMEDVHIEASHNQGESGGGNQISIGPICGWEAGNGGTIENVMATGSIIVSGKGQGVGGIVGAVGSVTLKNCLSRVQLIASGNESYLGGLIGVSKQNVKIESCVYDGPAFVNTGDSSLSAAVIGNVVSGTVTASRVFYDQDIASDTLGTGVNLLNTAAVTCQLNGGTWSNRECSSQTSNAWSVGFEHVSLFGSDGYLLTFDANGGDFAASAKTSKMVVAGAKITTDEIATPTREGYFFAGWAFDAKATAAEDLGNANSNATIYAVWDAGYTVFFNSDPVTFSDESPAKSVKVPTNGVISTDGVEALGYYEDGASVKHYFTGWAYEFGLTIDDTLHLASIEMNESNPWIDTQKRTLNLYAVWTAEPTYTVTFDANGHATPNVQSVFATADKVIEAPNLLASDGYELEGWYTDADFAEESAYAFGNTTEEDFTLYAKWTTTKYSITYNLNGGKNGNNPSSYTVESETILFDDPVRDGYVFGGWFYDENFTNPTSQISAGSTGNVSLYAKWTAVSYAIHYLAGKDAYGTVAAQTKAYGKPVKLMDSTGAFTREGYLISGWTTSDGGKKVYDFGATYEEDADLILYPVWKVDPNRIPKVSVRKANSRAKESNVWYDLHGRKLGAKPTVQGSYFYNGKRIVVK